MQGGQPSVCIFCLAEREFKEPAHPTPPHPLSGSGEDCGTVGMEVQVEKCQQPSWGALPGESQKPPQPLPGQLPLVRPQLPLPQGKEEVVRAAREREP